MKMFKSNCILECLKAKIRSPVYTKVYLVIPRLRNERGIPHFIWRKYQTYYHFTFVKQDSKLDKWYKFFYFKGYVELFPEEYFKAIKLKRIL